MNRKGPKVVLVVLAMVAILSLTITILLLGRLSGIRSQAEYWRKAHERLAREVRQIERERTNATDAMPTGREFLPQPKPVAEFPRDVSPAPEASKEGSLMLGEEFQGILASVIEEKLPELRLSDRDLIELTGAIKTIRESIQTMRELKRTSANVTAIKRARSQLDQSLQGIEKITGMDPGEFISRARPKPGIDNERFDDGEVVTEYLRDLNP